MAVLHVSPLAFNGSSFGRVSSQEVTSFISSSGLTDGRYLGLRHYMLCRSATLMGIRVRLVVATSVLGPRGPRRSEVLMSKSKKNKGRVRNKAFEPFMVTQALSRLVGSVASPSWTGVAGSVVMSPGWAGAQSVVAGLANGKFGAVESSAGTIGPVSALARLAGPEMADRFSAVTQLGSLSGVAGVRTEAGLMAKMVAGSVSGLVGERFSAGPVWPVLGTALMAAGLTEGELGAVTAASGGVGAGATLAKLAGPALSDTSAWAGRLGSVSVLSGVRPEAGLMAKMAAGSVSGLFDEKFSVSPGLSAALITATGSGAGKLSTVASNAGAIGSMSALAGLAGPEVTNRFSTLTQPARSIAAAASLAAFAAPALSGLFDAKVSTGWGNALSAAAGLTEGKLSAVAPWADGIATVAGFFGGRGQAGLIPGVATGSPTTLFDPKFTAWPVPPPWACVPRMFDVDADVRAEDFETLETTAPLVRERMPVPEGLALDEALVPGGDILRESSESIRLALPPGLRKAAPALLVLLLLQAGTLMQIGAPEWFDGLGKVLGFAVDGLEVYLALRVLWHLNQAD